MECSMSETEFLTLAEAVLGQIETGLEQAGVDADVDLE
jgi:frataxin-like iron-binding protein CyaY